MNLLKVILQEMYIYDIGDYTILFYDQINEILILTRDMFGKRSLLVQFDDSNTMCITSSSILSTDFRIFDVPANSILFIAMSETTGIPSDLSGSSDDIYQFAVLESVNPMTPSSIRWGEPIHISDGSDMTQNEANDLVKQALLKSVKDRVQSIPDILFSNNEETKIDNDLNTIIDTGSEVAVLFSGGVDSTLLIALLLEVFKQPGK